MAPKVSRASGVGERAVGEVDAAPGSRPWCPQPLRTCSGLVGLGVPPQVGNSGGGGSGVPLTPGAARPGAERNFLAVLFDLELGQFLTIRVPRFFDVLAIILGLRLPLSMLFGFASSLGGLGIGLGIVAAAVWFLLVLTGARLVVELLVVVFRLGEDVHAIRQDRSAGPRPGGLRPTA